MKTPDMPLIHLTGDARQRGLHYGKIAADLIGRNLQSWLGDLGGFSRRMGQTSAVDTEGYLQEFYSSTQYLEAIEQWSPELLEEIRGIAEGAGQPFLQVLGLQLMDEEWLFGLRRGLARPSSKCSAFGVHQGTSKGTFAGQNMDIPSWSDGRQVLLRVRTAATDAYVFSIAGHIGLNGLNRHALGITCNTLAQLTYATDGLPVTFIVRSVLAKHSLDEAEDFLRSIQHASGQNYILSSREGVRCFECCGSSVRRFTPKQTPERVFHSNHPLVNRDTSELAPAVAHRLTNSQARYDSLVKQLGDGTVNLSQVKAALAAHDDPGNPVSRALTKENRSNSIGFTAGASIYDYRQPLRLHLASGPPCETEFKVFEFDDESAADC